MDVTGDRSKVWCCNEQYCIGTWNLRSMNQGKFSSVQFSSVAQLCLLFVTPWIAARQASLSITNSRSLPKLMSIKSMMPPSHLILCRPLLLLPHESALWVRWPEYWSFSFSIVLSKEHSGPISFRMDWLEPQEYIIEHKEYCQYFRITTNGI